MRNGAFNGAFENIQMHEYSVSSGRWEPPLTETCQSRFCKEFKGDLSVGVWNATALFCLDPAKAKLRFDYVLNLASKVDILIVVEAHGEEGSQVKLEAVMQKTHVLKYYPGENQATGGVLLCLKNHLISKYGQPVVCSLDRGRVVSLRFEGGSGRLGVVGVHVNPNYSIDAKKAVIQAIANEILNNSDMLWIVGGDFNFEASGEKSYNMEKCCFVDSAVSESLNLMWNRILGDLLEHYQPDFTRAQNGPFGASISRLDRIYSNLPAWRLLGAEVRTYVLGQVNDEDRLSDHIPVVTFLCNNRSDGLRPIPVWTTNDPFFSKALDLEVRRERLNDMAPVEAVQRVKVCMRRASFLVVRKSLMRGALTVEERIYWSITCARALFHGCARRVIDSMVAYPFLEKFILLDTDAGTIVTLDLGNLNAHIAELMRTSIDQAIAEVESAANLPEYQKERLRCKNKRAQATWATRGRKSSLTGARDENGSVIADVDAAAAAFIRHWKAVAQEKFIDKRAAKSFLSEFMRKLPSFRIVLPFEAFLKIVRSSSDSACGPDGVPYAAWRNASDMIVYALYQLYCVLFTESEPAEDFNHSWLILLAKGDHHDDEQIVARAADDTRPVSLSNSDSKLCESAMVQPLAGAVQDWACEDQRGFMEGRIIVDNVIEVETYSRILALESDGVTSLPALALFDFASAFPSVAWQYLWLCMRYAGLPRRYIRAFQKLYKKNVHFLRFMGKIFEAYVNASGVKTGGTASGTLFILCMDPFLHLLRSRCRPRDFGRAFADDVGYVIFDIRLTLPAFSDCFELFGQVSNVRLKLKKTIIVPLWRCSIAAARALIVGIVPAWGAIRIEYGAKYLGIWMGPSSAEHMWRGALDKYITRVELARATGAGLFNSIMEYNIMCITTLSYVSQFSVAGADVLAVESRMLQKLVGSPRFTFSKEALWSLDALGMGKAFQSIRVLNLAAMTRTALKTSSTFSKMKNLLDRAASNDNAPLNAFIAKDSDLFDTPAIVNMMQKVIDHAFLPDLHRPAWQCCLRQAIEGDAANMQKQIVSHLLPVKHPFIPADFISYRLGRWLTEVSNGAKEWWGFSGAYFVHMCTNDLDGAPKCVIAACLKTILNGWATTRRCGNVQRQCVFRCGSKLDCLEHYLQCSRVANVWERLLGEDWGPFESRLGFGCCDVNGRVKRAYFLYAIYMTFNYLRRQIHDVSMDMCINVARCHLIYALGRSSSRMRVLMTTHQHTHGHSDRRLETPITIGQIMFTQRKRKRNWLAPASMKRKDNSESKLSKARNTARKLAYSCKD